MFEGQFIWRELLTPEPAASKAFYAQLFGWSFDDRPVPGMGTYTVLLNGAREVGGLMKHPRGLPEACWGGYADIDDVDAATARALAAGGQLCVPLMDIPEVGRVSGLCDPGGAIFYPFRPSMELPEGLSLEELAPRENEFGWAELRAKDLAKSQAFYCAAMGWRFRRVPVAREACVTIAPSDYYLNIESPLGARASIGLALDPERADSWLHYVQVASVERVAERVVAAGGALLLAPAPLGAGRVAIARDPLGAEFAFFG